MGLRDLRAGQLVSGEFVVQRKSLREFSSKHGRYLSLRLADEKGCDIEARMWDNAETAAAGFEVGDVVSIKGQAEEYKNQMQIKISSLTRSASSEVEKFIPALDEDQIGALAEKLKVLISSVEDGHLQELLEKILGDSKTWERFCSATAARSLHSAHIGGLLEHTVNVSVLCDAVCSLFPQINRDLLVTAALLHDIGKLDAYEVRGAVFEQTEAGKLIGEPVLSERRLSAAIVEIPGFPPKYHLLLSHLVLSHHGEFEFGAPILPSSLEALVLHHVDNLEAKTNGVLSIMKKEEDPERVWSEYSRLLERSIYLPRLETEGDIREGD